MNVRIAPVPGDHAIELASGAYLDLTRPDPTVITLDVVAHGLANTCRYAGHTTRYYSVAEHACLVAAKLRAHCHPPEVQLAGLHHDDAEAFVADIARPLKSLLQPAYDEITDRLDGAIGHALGVPLPALFLGVDAAKAVKDADNWALAAEAHYLLPSKGRGWWSEGLFDPARPHVQWVDMLGQRPDFARDFYLQTHRVLARQAAEATAA